MLERQFEVKGTNDFVTVHFHVSQLAKLFNMEGTKDLLLNVASAVQDFFVGKLGEVAGKTVPSVAVTVVIKPHLAVSNSVAISIGEGNISSLLQMSAEPFYDGDM